MGEAVAEASGVQENHRVRLGAVGWVMALISAAMFGTAGAFARPLLDAGWSPAAAVSVRLGGAFLLLAGPAALALRGRWHLVARRWRQVLGYGLLGGALAQVGYFHAIRFIDVGLALLLEYLAVVLVVLWVWVRHRRRPSQLAFGGMVVALTGLVIILNPGDLGTVDLRGIAWALLAAFGMAAYFVISAETDAVPPVAFVAAGLGVGAVGIGLAGMVGLVPLVVSTSDVVLLGQGVPWWVPMLELVVVAAALAYLSGFVAARRLGSTVASFVGLTEVMFAVVWAWLLLGQMPGGWQLAGGVVLLAGVAAVQRGAHREPNHPVDA
ncbi:MAG: DMT family transporter [Propioniciclava sp.]